MDYLKLFNTIISEMTEVFQTISYKNLDYFVSLVNDHQRIFLIGVGREGLATKAFSMRLMHLGKEAHWIWDDTCPAIEAGDLLIATMGDGEIGHIRYICERAKANGAKVCIVTGSPSGSGVQELADQYLFVPASVYRGKDTVVPSMQPMGNLFEQTLFVIFDVVIMRLQQLNPTITYAEMSKRHRNVE